jgi:hypothetical protein
MPILKGINKLQETNGREKRYLRTISTGQIVRLRLLRRVELGRKRTVRLVDRPIREHLKDLITECVSMKSTFHYYFSLKSNIIYNQTLLPILRHPQLRHQRLHLIQRIPRILQRRYLRNRSLVIGQRTLAVLVGHVR